MTPSATMPKALSRSLLHVRGACKLPRGRLVVFSHCHMALKADVTFGGMLFQNDRRTLPQDAKGPAL